MANKGGISETQAWLAQLASAIKKTPRLNVYTDQERLTLCGVLSKESVYAFTYTNEYSGPEQEVAIGLPYRARSYQGGDLFGIFSMNEPEGYLRLYIEDAMSRAGIPNKLLFLLLSQDLQVGRVSYAHEYFSLPKLKGEHLSAILGERSENYFEHLMARYALRSGLSGAQPKVLVPGLPEDDTGVGRWNKTTLYTPGLIVKEAGAEYPGIALSEHFCMSVARRAGLNTPDFWLSDDANRFVISRFDRDEHDTPVGFEDMATLLGLTAAQKYQGSYEAILQVTQTYCGNTKSATLDVFGRIAASVLLKDGDAHMKNFGLVYAHPGAEIRPSPVYDIVCTTIYPDLDRGLALKLNKSRTFATPPDLIAFAGRFGIESEIAADCVDRIESAIDETLRQSAEDPRYANDPHRTLNKLAYALRGATPVN